MGSPGDCLPGCILGIARQAGVVDDEGGAGVTPLPPPEHT